MYISQNSWHFQLYKFTKTVVERFKGNPYWDNVSVSKVNLCPYMRTILIWGPLVVSFYSFLYAFGLYVLVYLPITMTNGAAIMNTGLFIFVCALIAVALIGSIAFITNMTVGLVDKQRAKREEMEELGIKPSGFFAILMEYLKSLKSKTCVQLEVQ